MSGEGPESIPTSADPRSRRPLKKRALTPVSEQASALDALFARPDQEIRLPPSASSSALAAKDQLPAPPEIVSNVQGSSAGAGSGEFHVYKAARRREYERLRRMDDEVRRERADDEFARKRAELEAKDDERTRRNREKREKMKARKSKARAGGGGKDRQDANGAAAAGPAPAPKMMARPVLRIDRHASDAEEDAEATSQTAAPAAEPAGLMIHDDD